MCLIVFAWEAVPDYRLVLAANRDELHQRPSQELQWWPDRPDVLAGRDLQANGTWLAVNRSGRFATVTNYRENQRKRAGLLSRGEIVTDFVDGTDDCGSFIAGLDGNRYAGFSLLASDGESLWYVSNRGDGPTALSPGLYGLSNASLDTPWPKLERSRAALAALVDDGAVNETGLFRLLADRTTASAADIGADELPFEVARAVTAPFIVTPDYGTRCSTAVMWSNDDQVSISERRFDESGASIGESRFRFGIGMGQATA